MKIAIISLGCPKNQVDADVFCHALIKDGHTTVADPAEADIIIINTCGFIESAKTEAIENILMACQYKQENPDLKVIVTGCLAERYKQQIIQEIPEVDAVVGIGSNAALPAIVRRVCVDGAGQTESYGPKSDMQLGGARVISTPRHYAYLKIAEGCNNGCYYCAIPLIRGALRSREINDCVAEARWLAGEGVRELILVAQDPTAYGEDWGRPGAICELLDRLQEIDGIRWIRILYAYPERISDEFIAAMVRTTKVVPYLDLPIQHCDDAVLKAMHRRGGRKEIEDAIARLRAAIPGITPRTANTFALLCALLIPSLVYYSAWLLLTVLRRKLQPKAPVLFTALSIAFVQLLPLLHIALYRGMPDLLGVAFAFMLLALGVGYDFSQPASARLVSLAAFTGMLMLTRRSYMFTVVAFFLLYGIWVLARAARARQVQTALRFGRFAAASLVCVGVPLLPMFWRIAKADYSDRYATYQTGGFLAELANQRVYLGWLVFAIVLIGILYGLYNTKARALAVLAAVGAVLTVLLVTRVQNMDDHQSLAVAPFYLLGCFLCALLVSNLPWAWPRRILAVSAGVLCALNFGACSQLLPVVFPSGFYSGLYFYVDSPRNDLQQVAEVNAWLRENCTGENSAYMICHGVVYSPDVFRISALPDESIREILPYGACNPGNDAFPKELLTAQVVLTCTPFDPNNHTEKMNAAFLENQEKYAPFELAATFDMGNGYTITAYRRVKAPTAAELDTYRAYLAEENERFPYNFSAVWDELAVQFANNG